MNQLFSAGIEHHLDTSNPSNSRSSEGGNLPAGSPPSLCIEQKMVNLAFARKVERCLWCRGPLFTDNPPLVLPKHMRNVPGDICDPCLREERDSYSGVR